MKNVGNRIETLNASCVTRTTHDIWITWKNLWRFFFYLYRPLISEILSVRFVILVILVACQIEACLKHWKINLFLTTRIGQLPKSEETGHSKQISVRSHIVSNQSSLMKSVLTVNWIQKYSDFLTSMQLTVKTTCPRSYIYQKICVLDF